MTVFFIILIIILGLYSNKCLHSWQKTDDFHSKKEYTTVYTCNKCGKTKIEIHLRKY